jgi:tetratricopeptide (TPR) repeat protein
LRARVWGDALGLPVTKPENPSPAFPGAPASSGPGTSRGRDLAAAALVLCATLAAYLPALGGGFLWDDNFHVTKPALRPLSGLGRIWFEIGQTQQYYPLLHSAFWLEYRLWGGAVLGYHLVNVFLHAAAACVFGLILRRLFVPTLGGRAQAGAAALFGALLFALHPVCVESVAWISEQKNTLSTLFYLLSLLAYLGFDERGDRGRAWGAYALSLGLFVMALLSKSVTATLPAAILVVLWWRKGRLSWKRDAVPLLPWFAAGIASGLFTAWVERSSIRAEGADFDLTGIQRVLIAGRAVWFYLGKLAWPANLAFIYPHWTIETSLGRQALFPLGAAVLAAVLVLAGGRTRGALAAYLFFVGSLFPALGFFNVYPFKYAYVADHFQYLASLGVFALAAGSWGCWMGKAGPGRAKGAASLGLLCVLGALSWRQAGTYTDAETLYSSTLARNPDCWMAYNNLANLRLDRGRNAEAIPYYRRVLELRPGDAIPRNNLALALAGLGLLPEAIAQYRVALALDPAYPEAHRNLAVALRRAGRLRESIAQCEEALRLVPNYPEARADLARALALEGRLPEAVAAFGEALRIQPGNPETHADLATALSQGGRLPEAIAEYGEALRLKPDYAEACNNLGVALAGANRLSEAAARFEEAVRIKPGYADAHENLGQILRALGRTPEADAQAAKAARLRANPSRQGEP